MFSKCLRTVINEKTCYDWFFSSIASFVTYVMYRDCITVDKFILLIMPVTGLFSAIKLEKLLVNGKFIASSEMSPKPSVSSTLDKNEL